MVVMSNRRSAMLRVRYWEARARARWWEAPAVELDVCVLSRG
jgi:hypothetical protein